MPPDTSCPLGCSKISTKQLDLLDKTCPSTFLFTKLAMEELPKGELLEVHLSSQESARNVARSIEESGYRVVDQNTDSAREAWTVLIQKPQD